MSEIYYTCCEICDMEERLEKLNLTNSCLSLEIYQLKLELKDLHLKVIRSEIERDTSLEQKIENCQKILGKDTYAEFIRDLVNIEKHRGLFNDNAN